MAKNTLSPFIKALKFTLAPSILIYVCSAIYTWSFITPIDNFKAPAYGWVRLLMLICEIGFYIFLVYMYEFRESITSGVANLNFKEYTPPYASDTVSDRTNASDLRHLLYDQNIKHSSNKSNLRVFYSKNMVVVTDMKHIEKTILTKMFTEDGNDTTTS